MIPVPSPPQLAPITAAPARASAYKWWVVFLLWLVCFLNYADRQAISSVLPLLEKAFHFDGVQLGLIGAAFAWVYAAFALVAGLLADRISRKTVILGACVVWSMFTLATAWCGSLAGFISVRALTGLGETFYIPAAMSLLSDYHGRNTRSRALAWHQSAVYAGTVLGSWTAAVLAEKMGWQFPFYLFGPLGFLLAAVLLTGVREPGRGAADAADSAAAGVPHHGGGKSLSVRQTLTVIFRTPVALLLMAAFLLANFVAMIILTWMPTFLLKKFAFSLSGAGLSGTLYIQVASAVMVPIAGWLADRWARRYAAGRMAVQATGLALGALFVFLVGATASAAVLIAAMMLFGACKGFYDSGIFAALYDTIEPRARGTAAGIMNTVGWGGGALGPLCVGLAMKYGRREHDWQNMGDAIACCGAIYLVGAALVIAAAMLYTHRNATRGKGTIA
jgi:MFS family permease